MYLRRALCVAVGLAALFAVPVASGADFIYKALSIPLPSGATWGEATAVNNQGVVVGRWITGSPPTYSGFLFDSGQDVSETNPLDLGPLGPVGEVKADDPYGLWGINDSKVVVGTRVAETGVGNRSVMITFNPLDQTEFEITDITAAASPQDAATGAQARGINSLGTIAGIADFPCSPRDFAGIGCRWSPGGSFLSKLLAGDSVCSAGAALAVNEAGQLAGWAVMNVGTVTAPESKPRPFTCDDVGLTPLPTFTSAPESGKALSISTFGDVCGIAQDASDSGRIHPVAWLGGSIIKLNSIGGGFVEGSVALSINGATNIVGRSGSEDSGQAAIWFPDSEEPTPLTQTVDPTGHGAGYRLITAHSISDGGFIVGRGVGIAPEDSTGRDVPFILKPCIPVLISSPNSRTTCLRGTVALSVHAVGAVNPGAHDLEYHWIFEDSPLQNGPRPDGSVILGADSRNLTIQRFGFANQGRYSVAISGSCGGVVVNPPASVTVCIADLSCDGYVSDTDFPRFVRAYDMLDCADPLMEFDCPADLNRDGMVDDTDFVLFVQAYEQLFCF